MKNVIDFHDICYKNRSALESEYKKVGEGSSRIVFDIHDKYVLKKAKGTLKGEMQTEQEISLFSETNGMNRLCPIIYSTDDAIVAAKAIPLNTYYDNLPNKIIVERFKKFRQLLNDIKLLFPYRHSNKKDPKKIDILTRYNSNWRTIMNSKVFLDIVNLVDIYNICEGDLWRSCNWGYYRGYFVIIDYGLNYDVLKSCYP